MPFPTEFQRTFVFSAALASSARDMDAAKAVLQFLSGPEAATIIRAKGIGSAGTARSLRSFAYCWLRLIGVTQGLMFPAIRLF